MEIVYLITISSGSTVYMSDTIVPGDFSIEADTMCLTNILCDGQFELGKLNASMLEVSIYSLLRPLDVGGFNITLVEQTYNSGSLVSSVTLFTGKIDSATADTSNVHRDIVAYDRLYELRDKDITSFWNSTATVVDENNPAALFDCTITGNVVTWHPTSLNKIRRRLCKHFGITFVDEATPNTYVNDTATYTRDSTDISGITFGQALSMVCEIQALIPHIRGNGLLEFISIAVDATAVDITNGYNTVESTFETYETTPIDAIGVYSTSNELSMTIMPSSGDAPTNIFPIIGNIFLLDGILELAGSTGGTPDSKRYEVLMNTRDAIEGLTYTPAEIIMVETDSTLVLGQKVSITRADYWGNSIVGTHFIFSMVFSGSMFVDQKLNCPAEGETFSQKPSSANNDLSFGARFSLLKQGVETIEAQVGTKADSTHEGTSFGWQLTENGFILKSNDMEVMRVDATGLNVHGNGTFDGIINSSSDSVFNKLPLLQIQKIEGMNDSSISVAECSADTITANKKLHLVGAEDEPSNEYIDTVVATRMDGTEVLKYAEVDPDGSYVGLEGSNMVQYAVVHIVDQQTSNPISFNYAKTYRVKLVTTGMRLDLIQDTVQYYVDVTVAAGETTGSVLLTSLNRVWKAITNVLVSVSPSSVSYRVKTGARNVFRFYNDMVPYFTNTTDLGRSDFRFRDIYSVNAPNYSSDRRLKVAIEPLDKYDAFFDNLKPVSFLMNNRPERRIGFIAQDVLKALEDVGMTKEDFDGYVDGETLALRYAEFIALNTYEIQKIKKELSDLRKNM